MCIVAREVKLSNTSIFTCVSAFEGDNNSPAPARQLVMYQNKATFTNKDVNENIMCLPIPLKDGLDPKENIVLYDFSAKEGSRFKQHYKDFFTNINTPFKVDSKFKSKASSSMLSSSSSSRGVLEVITVGGYQCSLARTHDDVMRLDPKVFGEPVGMKEVLERNYPQDFAFLLCLFKRDAAAKEFHPIVYSHPISQDGNFFIPTRHYHGKGKPNEDFVDDWDHNIYIFGANNAQIEGIIKNSKHKKVRKVKFTPAQKTTEESIKLASIALKDLLKDSKTDAWELRNVFGTQNACKLRIEGSFENMDFQPQVLLVQ